MEKLDLYIEWKELVKKSKEINARKREIKSKLGNVSELKIDSYAFKEFNKPRASDMKEMYVSGSTLQEIGDIYGVTRERVRQILSGFGVDRNDGGIAKKIEMAKSIPCSVDDCNTLATGVHGYCRHHYIRVRNYGTPKPKFKREFMENDGGCLVEGCDRPFSAYGLCNKHKTNYYIQRERYKNVTDLNDFLKVQKAKRMMGKTKINYSKIREFMNNNPEHFKKDLYVRK
ncbi:sigma factor-like helix-turn-helix DNA-binding protein [Virgibacillus sp. C22-A2]|uniref:Sigma factor-like helix-turn-helix DNA-binding protein n=1 Tax=Virgibacillus tibetensis TaxID=3042313 RepID=A0ABU6KAZ3_9BACI|nr:sigma factor-like helix-turn-helix DNA-binding protein [Virgibacillus sp. C22-A2]